MLKNFLLTLSTFLLTLTPVFAVGDAISGADETPRPDVHRDTPLIPSYVPTSEGFAEGAIEGDDLLDANIDIKTPVNVFVRDDCVHCQNEEAFLAELQNERQDFEVFYHDIADEMHYSHFDQLTTLEGITKSTPITLLGNTLIQGFGSADSTGVRIRELLDASAGKATLDFPAYIAAGGSGGAVETVEGGVCEEDDEECVAPESRYLVDIPFFGVVDVAKYSLPTMSIILGFIDGFNPCAMWVLVTFLIVLLQIGDKRKMFQIAGLFIFAEAVMYYLILNVWFTAWDFVGLDKFVTPIVGLIAVGGGVFFLYEGITSDGTCKVTNPEQRAKIHGRIKDLAAKPMTWGVVLAILALAFSVNVIEFACSIGIPQAFTKILDINMLSALKEQMLIGIYIAFYMVDDLIVFGIALAGIEKLGITHKYSKYSNLIGGVLMLLLGGLLMFAPELLKF
jgi:cytochrome c biogenesis protein CcdA